jgi:hypothetical protein
MNMTIRELIEELEEIAKDHGDEVQVVVVDYENGPDAPTLSFRPADSGEPPTLRIT